MILFDNTLQMGLTFHWLSLHFSDFPSKAESKYSFFKLRIMFDDTEG